MKTMNWIVGILTAGVLVLAGCGKSDKSGQQGPQAVEMRGVKVDLPKLREIVPPELQPVVNDLNNALRYGQFPQAQAQLQKLSAAPNLNDEQKKVINDVAEQVKQMEAKNSGK